MKSEFHNCDIGELMKGVLKSVTLLNKEIESHFGMSSARILTLLAFTEKEIMQMNELSEEMSLTTSTSTRMIDSLVKEGFVERGYDKFDRRLVTVGLTVNGKKIAEDIKPSCTLKTQLQPLSLFLLSLQAQKHFLAA
jgi:DNA-binding MarR family transcriptional regulator